MKKLVILLLVALTACGNSSNSPSDAAPRDAAPDAHCFEGTPTTNDEIINACTPDSVVKIYKDTHPPLLNDDGTLPPLPP